MNLISLFSGAGGLDIGFSKAGFNIIYANEKDKTIHDTYRYNHKGTFLDTRDIRDVNLDDLPKNIDGIIGGPPCQSWSLAGSMKGINDNRGKLFYEYLRILQFIKPKFFLIENVKGMLSKTHINDFNNLIKLFKQEGYNCSYKLLDSHNYETAQNRERVFVVGFREDLNIIFEFPNGINKKIYLKDVLDIELIPKVFDKNNIDSGNNEYLVSSFSSIFMSRNRVRQLNEPSFTIQANGRQIPLHPSSPKMIKVGKDKFKFDGDIKDVRRFSVRECANIQGFPKSFKFLYKNINDGYKMVGNAVPINLSYHLAKKIKKAIQL